MPAGTRPNADMRSIPDHLRKGPIHRSQALDEGVSRDVLEGVQFRWLHKSVYVHRDHEMTWDDHVEAALLALPDSARTTGATRLRQLGLDVGSPFPLHFVVDGDLHLVLDGVFLHRTVKMPPHHDDGVTAEAAFVAYCAEARLIDAIKVGSVMLNEEMLDLDLLGQILAEEKWRRGVPETAYVIRFLNGRCRSMPEAELFTFVCFAGVPVPEVNVVVELAPGVALTPDLWWEQYRQAAEYEGSQHQEDRPQYNSDIDRYADYRKHGAHYVQITRERMRSPRATVRRVHAELVDRGYDGPPPDFGWTWDTLFRDLTDLVRRRRAG